MLLHFVLSYSNDECPDYRACEGGWQGSVELEPCPSNTVIHESKIVTDDTQIKTSKKSENDANCQCLMVFAFGWKIETESRKPKPIQKCFATETENRNRKLATETDSKYFCNRNLFKKIFNRD